MQNYIGAKAKCLMRLVIMQIPRNRADLCEKLYGVCGIQSG